MSSINTSPELRLNPSQGTDKKRGDITKGSFESTYTARHQPMETPNGIMNRQRQNSSALSLQHSKDFSLIELLVVVAIFFILASLLSPALKKALRETKTVQCGLNLKGMNAISMQYSEDYNNILPACHTGNNPKLDFLIKSTINPNGIYPDNTSFLVMIMGYMKGLPLNLWTTHLGEPGKLPDPMFICPEGDPVGVYYDTYEKDMSKDKRNISYNTFRYIWKYIHGRKQQYNVLPSNSNYGDYMQLPLTEISYPTETLFLVDTKARSLLSEASPNKPLFYDTTNQLVWDGSGVRVEHDGKYQMVMFDGSAQLLSYPDVQPSLTYKWLENH